MAHDFKKKEPSKTDKMLYELAMAQHQMEKGLWSTSTVVMALAVALKVNAKDVAKFMVNDAEIKEFSQKVNDEIRLLEAEKNKAQEPTKEEVKEKSE